MTFFRRSGAVGWCVVVLMAVSASAKNLDTLFIEGLLTTTQIPMVRNQVGLRTGEDFDARELSEAIKKLYRLGLYRSVEFLVTDETDSSVSLALVLKEFPIVETHEIAGAKKLTKDDIEKVLTIKNGRALSDALIFDNVKAIKKAYAEKGYLRAEVVCDTIPTKVPGNVIAKFRIKEGPKVQVKKIAFVNNAAFKQSRLKLKFKTKERKLLWGGEFEQETYRLHLDSLIMFYNDEGYLDAEVASDSFWFDKNGKDVYVQVALNEGRKYYRGDIFFAGNKVIETPELDAQIAMKRAKPFNRTKFEATKDAVSGRYREEGYLWVQVIDKRSFRGDTIDVTFDIVEGLPAIVRKVDIKGNTKTMEKVIRREIRLMPGRKYKQSLMARSVRELMQLNYFNNVNPDLRPNDDGTVDFVFDIQEKDNIGQLQVGASYSKVERLQGTFTTSIPNFRGAGQTLELDVAGGRTAQRVNVSFTEPYAFDTPTLLRGNVFWNRRIYELSGTANDDTVMSYGFAGTVGRRLKWPDDYFSASATYQISREEQYGTGADYIPEYDLLVLRRGTLSRLSFSLSRNDCDLAMFPTRGTNFFVRPEIAGLGGNFKYLKAMAGFDTYYPLFWKVVLGTHTKVGLIGPLGNQKITTGRLDLFSGGGESMWDDVVVRGYVAESFGRQTRLSKNSSRSTYERGLNMLNLSAEISVPVVDQMLYLLTFADMGNCWPEFADISLRDLYHGVGVGARLSIPMLGLLGFDFGWGLDAYNKDDHFYNRFQPQVEFHFTMGKGY